MLRQPDAGLEESGRSGSEGVGHLTSPSGFGKPVHGFLLPEMGLGNRVNFAEAVVRRPAIFYLKFLAYNSPGLPVNLKFLTIFAPV
jgi:hypothetical protein